jgi:rubredoxin
MVDIIGMAKELIQKGDALGDSELIAMGMAMLEKYDNNNAVVSDNGGLSKYVCSNCGHEFIYDKPERKKQGSRRFDDCPGSRRRCSRSCHRCVSFF